MLISIDIIIPKDVDLVILEKIGYISSYRTTFNLTITPLIRPFLKRNIILGAPISIPVYSNIVILIEYIDLPNRDFIFEPSLDYPIVLFILLIDSTFYTIIVRNNSEYLIYLPRKLYISTIIDLDVEGYYYINDPDI